MAARVVCVRGEPLARLPPIVSFAAPTGTGKTTLLEGVIEVLTGRGHRVSVLKHDAHRLELDREGKDTWRFRKAGAWRAVIVGDLQLAVFSAVDGEASLAGLVDAHLADADIVLTEGFRKAGLPTVRVHREARGEDPHWERPENVIAWVSDVPLEVEAPILPLDRPEAVADFLEARFLAPGAHPRRATLAIPVGSERDLDPALALVDRLAPRCGGRSLLVHAQEVTPPPGTPAVVDIRPDLGPLGALLTALAAAGTPEVLLVGIRHRHTPPALAELLLVAGPRVADVVVPVHHGFREPLLAVYGHRCLGAIHAALVSGEPKMDGWWGQVRVHQVSPETWRTADPEGRAFP
ncbi:MAG: molybdopterin-guanine dinucleotide biosynthesis protein B [Deltaproteobacteria bacterium]|nr:molybdopterin-guanine dinucleotide biosynthesis protein B [Deltaproteobacteria bacterium]